MDRGGERRPGWQPAAVIGVLFAAFTLSAILTLVEPSDEQIDWASALVLAAGGLLLASLQLGVRRDAARLRRLRGWLNVGGGVAVLLAVGLLVCPPGGPPLEVAVGLAVLALGVLVPLVVRDR